MCFLGILKSAQHKCYWEACATYWNYQGFLPAWEDLLNFSVPGGEGELLSCNLLERDQNPS